MTDPISDMLTRIRNAAMAKQEAVLIPFSKLKIRIAQILEQEKYINSAKETEVSGAKSIQIKLKYNNDKTNAIKTIKRISKPGLRVYVSKDELPSVLQGYGIAIISTPQGLLTNKEAKKRGIGGEVMCEIS